MPSNWDVYYVVFLSAFLALGIPALIAFVAYVVFPRLPMKRTLDHNLEVNHHIGQHMNVRFFLGVQAAMLLLALALLLIPCAGTLQPGRSSLALLKGLIAIVSVALFAVLGLLYATRKGDLSWIRSFHKPSEGEPS